MTFPSGISSIVGEILKENSFKVKSISDGIAEVNADSSGKKLLQYRFLTNVFIELAKTRFCKNVETTITSLSPVFPPDLLNFFRNKFFKIRVSYLGKLIPFDKRCLAQMERRISQQYNLTLNPTVKANEFWIFIRDDNRVFFGLKISKEKSENKVRHKGELKVEIASIMSSLINKADSIVIDPFTGYGGLTGEILRNTRVKQCICNDINENCLEILKSKYGSNKKLKVFSEDFSSLSYKHNIDYIITDPPWGDFAQGVDYKNMLLVFLDWLNPQGTMILLISVQAIHVLEEALKTLNCQCKKFNVLIGGNKAFIILIQLAPTNI